MVPSIMFGDIKEFLDEQYFSEHEYGDLFDGTRHFGIEFFAIGKFDAYDAEVFSPGIQDATARQGYIDYIVANAINYRDVALNSNSRILVLSTCSPGATNERNVLFGVVSAETFPNPFVSDDVDWVQDAQAGGILDVLQGLWLRFWWIVVLIALVLAVGFLAKQKHDEKVRRP
jgi:sortase B